MRKSQDASATDLPPSGPQTQTPPYSQPLILMRHFEAAAVECFAAAGVMELISASIPRSDTELLCQEGAEF